MPFASLFSRPSAARPFIAAFVLSAAALAHAAALAQSMVRVETTQGPIDLQLYDNGAPLTVANFLGYVRRGDYADTLVHRSVPGFVIQTGGYAWPPSGFTGRIALQPPVANEFSAARSNLRGTVAMAKLGGLPDSATSEWFVNLVDNSGPCPKAADGREGLDCQNGGFTVFGRVTAPGMAVVDKIAAMQRVNASGVLGAAFGSMPVVSVPTAATLRENSVLVTRVAELPQAAQQSASDRVFNYLEAAYPQYLSPARGEAGNALGYAYRYYAGSNAYVGTKDDKVWYLVPSIANEISLLGELPFWLDIAVQAGY